MTNTESKYQKQANARWRKRNRDKDRLYSDRSAAKRYVRKESNIKRLRTLDQIVKDKIMTLTRKE